MQKESESAIKDKEAAQDAEMPQKKKSKLRAEIEGVLKEKGISIERRITIVCLDTGETHYFDDYPDAMQFMKGKKGRWYLATPGIRRESG
jgi:hypothetical protein